MGFFKAMGRIVSGKPVFDEEDGITQIHSSGMGASPHIASDETSEEHDGIIKNSPSTFPVVVLEDVRSDESGHELEIRAYVKNEWHFQVIVQTVRGFGQTHQLGVWLQPHQAKEIVLYKGPAFPRQPGYELLVDYKTEHEGDYFEAIHDIRYSYNSYEKTYEVSDVRLRMPIRDIYG